MPPSSSALVNVTGLPVPGGARRLDSGRFVDDPFHVAPLRLEMDASLMHRALEAWRVAAMTAVLDRADMIYRPTPPDE